MLPYPRFHCDEREASASLVVTPLCGRFQQGLPLLGHPIVEHRAAVSDFYPPGTEIGRITQLLPQVSGRLRNLTRMLELRIADDIGCIDASRNRTQHMMH